jgi:hypothetical protein
MALYIAYNGVEPTTASRVAVATGTAIKTLMQVATPSTCPLTVVEWGISFDGSAAATPGIIELIETDVAATSGTSLTPTKYSDPLGPVSLCVGGTGATNYSPSAEGTITAIRSFDTQHIAPTNQYVKQFPLGREPFVPISKFLRVRVKFAATVNAICYVLWAE